MQREVEEGVSAGGEAAARWERVLREIEGPGREEGAFTHLLTPPRDVLFMERLGKLSREADERGEHGGERGWVGDYSVLSEYMKAVRLRLGELRERYNKAVEEGRKVRGLEDIGLGWEEVMGRSKGEGEGASGDGGTVEV